MKGLYLRLVPQNGETIVETLAAILIAALSCTLLLGAVTAGVHINQSSKRLEDTYQQELMAAELGGNEYNDLRESIGEAAEGYTPTTASGNIRIQESEGIFNETYAVDYTGGEGRLTSYQLQESSSEGTGD